MGALRGLLPFYARQSARYVRYWIRRMTRPATISVHGIRVPLPEDCSEDLRQSLYMERHERRIVLFIVAKLRPDDIVLEMGSGRGVVSTLCAKAIGSDRVFTFEANPELIPFIRKVYALNGVQPHLVNAAVGPEEAQVPFHVQERTSRSSLLAPPGKGETILVRQAGVNSLLAEIKPTFLVVDIEGAEGAVLQVARLEGVRIIALELHRRVLAEEGLASLMQSIVSQGFREHRWLSTGGRKLFERTLPLPPAQSRTGGAGGLREEMTDERANS